MNKRVQLTCAAAIADVTVSHSRSDMGRYCLGQKSKSDISVCSVSWSRTTSGYIGQLHRNFSLMIGCRYGWTTLEFRRIRFPAEIEIRYFGVLSVFEQNDIWISRATSQNFFSRDWLSFWRNDILFFRWIRFLVNIEKWFKPLPTYHLWSHTIDTM